MITKSIDIGCAADDVFAYVSDQTNAPRWQRGVREVRRTTEGPIGLGTRHTAVRAFMGRTLELSNEYTRYELNRLVEFKIAGTVPGQAFYVVEPAGTGRARLTSRIEMPAPGPFRVAERLLKARLREDVELSLRNLKDLRARTPNSYARHWSVQTS
jgi:hypothetical protein